MSNVPLLSTGAPATVKNWIDLATLFFGEDSEQVKFLASKSSEANGLDEPIIADERQLISVLFAMPHKGEK